MHELAPPITMVFPSRWKIAKTPEEEATDLDSMAKLLIKGCEAISGIYMRMCDTIRSSELPESAVRAVLERHFPQPRVSEILRVARAPQEIYSRYTAGFFGFKAALRECRAYTITPNQELTRRQVRRAAERLVRLLKSETVLRVAGRTVTVT